MVSAVIQLYSYINYGITGQRAATHVAEALDPGGDQEPREEQGGSGKRREDQPQQPRENEHGSEQPQEDVDHTLTIDNIILKR